MNYINVHIGEVRLARNGETLKALLGSCVGVGLIWRKKGICALAHCLLPKSTDLDSKLDGRFVNHAVVLLLRMVKAPMAAYSELEAVVVGGGNMTSPGDTPESKLIGMLNLKVAEKELKISGIRIVLLDGGGQVGRKLFINAADCSYHVEKIPRIVHAA